MKRILFLISFSFISFLSVKADTIFAYRVIFKDKIFSPTLGDSNSFVSSKAIARRAKQKITFNETDRPVSQKYIDSVLASNGVFHLQGKSKWFNSIVVLSTSPWTTQIDNMSFVQSSKLVGYYPKGWTKAMKAAPSVGFDKSELYVSSIPATQLKPLTKKTRSGPATYGQSWKQIHLTNTDYLHDLGFKGENMLISVIDMGFQRYKQLPLLDSVVTSNRIVDVYNFVKDTINVDSFSIYLYHGTDCLGTLAGNAPGIYVGSAPQANYCLYMSEDYAYESPIEEDNWIFAAERADSIGVDLISTSLGYYLFDSIFTPNNYQYATDFDGKTTLIAQGHNMATSKGMFTVCANGNFGILPWRYLITPADADSVYSVGMCDSFGHMEHSYSSAYGPSADGQVKPDGMSVGHQIALVNNFGGVAYSNGTSFSAPLTAGGIACLMQALPTLPVWTIKKLVHESSSRFLTPTDSFGYGIPNFKIAYETGKILSVQNINLVDNEYIKIFPSPSSNYIQIINALGPNYTYQIIAPNGDVLASKINNNDEIDISQLPKGNYFLRLFNSKELMIKQFQKI